MLAACIAAYLLSTLACAWGVFALVEARGEGAVTLGVALLVAFAVLLTAAIILSCGFFTLQPGQTRVCVLFGKYAGTVREEGFRWANPFYSRSLGSTQQQGPETSSLKDARLGSSAGKITISSKVSVRARTLTSEHLKVNDKMGNPIEIASVVVWHVQDTAKAVFDVDDYEQYVAMQSETALRHVASVYAYDHMDEEDEFDAAQDDAREITLRANVEEVSRTLRDELEERLAAAGVAIDDARLTHLAYAPEIAQAMLRRQQAQAVISARRKIVEGAVSMVTMAIEELGRAGTVELDDERRAAMASNLMVVLCGDSEAQPVLNAGTLYQ